MTNSQLTTIDLSDQNIVATKNDQIIHSCGYALLQQPLHVGDEARAKARLYPKETNNQYWQDLNQAELRSKLQEVRSHADLCWHQLKRLFEELSSQEVILITPAHYSEDQLSLLLGIANSLEVTVQSLVNRPVLYSAANEIDQAHRSIELQLHQTVIADISVTGGTTTLSGTEILSGLGLLDLYDHVARFLQRLFITTTRFDPLHDAKTEQQLYDSIPIWIDQLHDNSSIKVELNHAGMVYQAALNQEDLKAATSEPIASLLSVLDSGLQGVSVPALIKQLLVIHEFDIARVIDTEFNPHKACQKLIEQLKHFPETSYLESLEIAPDTEKHQIAPAPSFTHEETTPESEVSEHATHILLNSKAWSGDFFLSLSNSGLQFVRQTPAVQLAVVSINSRGELVFSARSNDFIYNDQPVKDPISLLPGDRITYVPADCVMQAIQVSSHEKTPS